MPKLKVTDREGVSHEVEAEAGQNIMEALRDLDDGVEALCGGMCSCATCHVYIESNWFAKLTPAQDDELELLEETECFDGARSRLSCQVDVSEEMEGLVLEIAPEE